MFRVKDIQGWSNKVQINNNWVLSRPEIGNITDRISDALDVLIGNADAIKWEEDQ